MAPFELAALTEQPGQFAEVVGSVGSDASLWRSSATSRRKGSDARGQAFVSACRRACDWLLHRAERLS